MSKPTVWTTSFTSAFFSSAATAQGSALQVSTPSDTRMTLVNPSLVLSCSAAIFTEAVIGVMPLGEMPFTCAISAAASTGPTGFRISMSPQSPLRRWP